jgi:hypothetical protein
MSASGPSASLLRPARCGSRKAAERRFTGPKAGVAHGKAFPVLNTPASGAGTIQIDPRTPGGQGEMGDEFLALYDRPASRRAYWKGLAAVIDATVNPRATLWQLIGWAFDGDDPHAASGAS